MHAYVKDLERDRVKDLERDRVKDLERDRVKDLERDHPGEALQAGSTWACKVRYSGAASCLGFYMVWGCPRDLVSKVIISKVLGCSWDHHTLGPYSPH